MEKFTIHYLKNGLKYMLIPDKTFVGISIFVYVKVGSKYENMKNNGISHFIEHMVFKGTTKYPKSMDITKEMDSFGSEFNAYTDKHYTAYHTTLPPSNHSVSISLEILSQMLFSSLIRNKDMSVERKVVLEEINKEYDDEDEYIHRFISEYLFKESELEKTIIGTKETIAKISRLDMLLFLEKYYKPSNVKIVICGNIPNNIHKYIKKYFDNINPIYTKLLKQRNMSPTNTTHLENEKIIPFVLNQDSYQVISVHRKQLSQTLLVLAFPTGGLHDTKHYTIDIIDTILAENMSSRLFMKLREENGLVYSVSSDYDAYEESGYYCIMTKVIPANVSKAVKIIINELKKMKNVLVGKTEFKKAMDSTINSGKLLNDDSEGLVEHYGEQFLFKNEILTPEQMLLKYKDVTIDKMKNISQELFNFNKMTVISIGKTKKEELENILKNIH